jgi:hypothetical protein
MIKAIVVNILLLLVLYVLYVGFYFGFGYLLPALSGQSGSVLYVLVCLLHLIINYLLLKKWNLYNWKTVTLFSLFIVGIYIGRLFIFG